jgi:hypothetical protein
MSGPTRDDDLLAFSCDVMANDVLAVMDALSVRRPAAATGGLRRRAPCLPVASLQLTGAWSRGTLPLSTV